MTEVAASTTATLLFTDVEGSTELRVRMGDAPATAILREHEDVVRRCVKEHGGWEVKALGDGFLVAFDSARRAAACAVSIQKTLDDRNQHDPDRGVRVRMGLHSGEVDRLGGDVYGQAVHIAARIAATAAGGEILVSDAVRQLVAAESGLRFRDRGRHRLKGLAEKMRLHELVWSEKRPAVIPATIFRRTPFVGRTDEQAELLRHLDAARAGQGGLLFIGGEPGVGKSRLTEELAVRAGRAGVQVLFGHSYEMEGGSPFIPFVEIFEQALAAAPDPETFLETLGDDAPEVARLVPRLRRLFPDLPPPLQLPADQERRYLFEGIGRVLTRIAAEAPVLVVLDDLHWADEATLRLVDHLAPRLPEAPILVVATYRDTEVASLSRLFGDLHRRRLAHHVMLQRLGEETVAEIVTALSGREPPPSLSETIYRETEGNPFFVEEIFRYLVEDGRLFDQDGAFRPVEIAEIDVPVGVRLVIGRRLERLSGDAQRLLAAAAVAGRVFSFRLLQALAHLPADAVLDVVDEAEHAMLVRESGGEEEFLFAHELIRQTLVANLSSPRRRRAHVQAAEAMIQVWAASLDEHAAEIAHHLAQAGDEADPKQLLEYSLQAGERALATSAYQEAFTHLNRAAGMDSLATSKQRAQLFFELGKATQALGRQDDAIAAWERSLQAYEEQGDPEGVGRVALEAGGALLYAGRHLEAETMVRRGLAALAGQVSADRARLLSNLATMKAFAGDLPASDLLYEEARVVADALADQTLWGYLHADRAHGCHVMMRAREGVETALAGAAALRAAGNLWSFAEASWAAGWLLWCTGHFDESAAVTGDLLPIARRLGHSVVMLVVHRAQGPREFFRSGNVEALIAEIKRDIEIGTEHTDGVWNSWGYAWLGTAEFVRGDWDLAGQWFRQASDTARISSYRGWCWGSWFLYLAYSGRRAEALAFLEGKRSELPRPGQPNTTGAWGLLFALTEGLFVLDQPDEPAAWYPLIVQAIRDTGTLIAPYAPGQVVERLAGIAATAAGNWNAAEEHFQRALHQADELPHQLERLETRRFYAQMLLQAQRDGRRAGQLLDEAIDGYRRLGMPRHEEMAGRMAREA